MKKYFLIFFLMFVFILFPVQTRADNDTISDLSEDSVEIIVDKVLELDSDGSTRDEIVDAILDMVDEDEDEGDDEDDEDTEDEEDDDGDDNSNHGKSSIKKVNFGQFKKMLKRGDSSQEITDLQEALNKVAFDLGLVFDILITDGKFGPNTVKVVKMIQAHQQVLADGIVGPITLEKLNKLLAELQLKAYLTFPKLLD